MPTGKMQSRLVKRVQLALTCCSIAANAICAGGIFTFPLMAPALSSHLKLTQPQLTTVALAGMIGQYPFAALVGKAIDYYGPWACSLASSILFSVGFGLFSLEIAKTPDDIKAPSSSSFERLAFFYFLAGLGTVTSYFSSLFAASKNFPNYLGIASGTSMALFGLSPLFLSLLASAYFTSDKTGLDVTRFTAFIAILAGIVHAIGAFNLHTPPNVDNTLTVDSGSTTPLDEERGGSEQISERTPLVPGKPTTIADVRIFPVEDSQTIMDLLKDPYFWILAMIVMLTLGSCEMVISNVGSIVLSLPSSLHSGSSTAITTSTQVRLLSISNTFSRLLAGPLADFISPVASYLPCGTLQYPRKHWISRIAFLSASSLLLALTFGWMEVGIRSQQGIWALSIGTGIAYGTVFTVLPSIVSSVWGLSNLGRNFGVITYAPFIGTPLFSYLYAFVSASHAQGKDQLLSSGGDDTGVCKGLHCWQLTFSLTTLAGVVSFLGTLILWRRWQGRV